MKVRVYQLWLRWYFIPGIALTVLTSAAVHHFLLHQVW